MIWINDSGLAYLHHHHCTVTYASNSRQQNMETDILNRLREAVARGLPIPKPLFHPFIYPVILLPAPNCIHAYAPAFAYYTFTLSYACNGPYDH